MKILIHDYAGHPFQVELSRSLARRGHTVLHLFSGSVITPQAGMTKTASDPATFSVQAITLAEKIKKSNLIARRGQEIEHGRLVCHEIEKFKPDVMVSSNTPLDSQRLHQVTCDRLGIPMVYWLQDLIGVATMALLRERLPVAGWMAGKYYMGLETKLLKASKSIVAISEDFKTQLLEWKFDPAQITVIENWAPLAEVPLRPKVNPWSEKHSLSKTFNFQYSGTLGMKHNPDLLLLIAKTFKSDPNVRVIVVSEGQGRKWLEEQVKLEGLSNMCLYDFQDFSDLPDMLGSADVVIAILTASAGAFSVPSKVMTYMCSGKPMLLAVPPENLASRAVKQNDTGLTSPPDGVDAFIENAKKLYADADLRKRLGCNGRAFAEQNFDIEKITDRFEKVFSGAVAAK